MPKDSCPKCNNLKDQRAKLCHSCRFKFNHPRKNTGVGRRPNTLGYITIMKDNKEILEHRAIMEDHLGRKLSSEEHVHHKNRIKTDNRIDNFELLNVSDHHRKHMTSEVAKSLSILGHKARWGFVEEVY